MSASGMRRSRPMPNSADSLFASTASIVRRDEENQEATKTAKIKRSNRPQMITTMIGAPKKTSAASTADHSAKIAVTLHDALGLRAAAKLKTVPPVAVRFTAIVGCGGGADRVVDRRSAVAAASGLAADTAALPNTG